MPEIILETERLIFRTEAEGDLDKWMRDFNTAAVREHLGGLEEWHEAEAKFANGAAMQARLGYSYWFVLQKETGDLIGLCGLKQVDSDVAPMQGMPEIGWIFRQDMWGKGYAFEAASGVLEHAFNRLHLGSVISFTSERNVASWRLMEKLGMIRRKDLDFDDPDYPAVDNPTIVYVKERPSA